MTATPVKGPGQWILTPAARIDRVKPEQWILSRKFLFFFFFLCVCVCGLCFSQQGWGCACRVRIGSIPNGSGESEHSCVKPDCLSFFFSIFIGPSVDSSVSCSQIYIHLDQSIKSETCCSLLNRFYLSLSVSLSLLRRSFTHDIRDKYCYLFPYYLFHFSFYILTYQSLRRCIPITYSHQQIFCLSLYLSLYLKIFNPRHKR